VRERLGRDVPVVILTGDISTEALRDIAGQDCVQLNKPVKSHELSKAILRLLAAAAPRSAETQAHRPDGSLTARPLKPPVIFVVDDDDAVRDALCTVLEDGTRTVK